MIKTTSQANSEEFLVSQAASRQPAKGFQKGTEMRDIAAYTRRETYLQSRVAPVALRDFCPANESEDCTVLVKMKIRHRFCIIFSSAGATKGYAQMSPCPVIPSIQSWGAGDPSIESLPDEILLLLQILPLIT